MSKQDRLGLSEIGADFVGSLRYSELQTEMIVLLKLKLHLQTEINAVQEELNKLRRSE